MSEGLTEGLAGAGSHNLLGDLSTLNTAVSSHTFDFNRIKPLLKAILGNESDNIIWDKVCDAVTESIPPPRSVPSTQQTLWLRNTSSFVNSSERRKYVDDVLKEELGSMHVGVPGSCEVSGEPFVSLYHVVLSRDMR